MKNLINCSQAALFFLKRVDGHAAIANAKALGSLTAKDAISGGEIGEANGNLTGMLIDNAIDLVARKIPSPVHPTKK